MDTKADIHVLVVTEESLEDEVYEPLAADEQVAVSHSEDGKSAAKMLGEQGFDAVVVDLDGPQGADMETLGLVNGQTHGAPVIVLTGDDSLELAAAAIRLGADDALCKQDLAGRRLVRAVRRSVQRSGAVRAVTLPIDAYARWTEATGDGRWEWDVADGTVAFSDSWRGMLEVGDDIDQDGPVEPWLDRLHPDDAPSVRALAELRLPDDDPSFTVEFRIQAGNGGWRWMYTRGYAERNSRGFSTKLFGSTTDITSTRRNPCLRCGADEGTRTCDGVHCGGNLAPGAIEIADTILPCPRAEVRAERVIAGAYRLVEAVAMGAAGTVFRAERISDGQVCAVKVLHHWLLGVTDALERFAKESRLQRKLKHPNIVALFDVVVEDDVNAIVMEYVPGPTLTKFLESGACPSDPVARVEMFLPVLAAMEVAHRNKVIHRDIKPDNILVLDDGVRPVLKVTDFGLARNERLSTMTMPGVTMGTARYMSPEQFVDARLADRRTDIYAIGCCLYEMLTGQPMFDYEADFKILIAHLDEPPRHPSDVEPAIPRRLGDAVLRAVSKKPEHRPQSCNEFATDLVRALEG